MNAPGLNDFQVELANPFTSLPESARFLLAIAGSTTSTSPRCGRR
jgi:hypothetical protein